MRIRKRPSQSPDPSLQVLPPKANGRGGAVPEEGLHPVGDLRVRHPGEIINSTSISDPHPDQVLPARRRLLQGLKEEEVERGVDSNKGCNARVTSCCCCSSSSSGAVASSGAVQAGEMVTLQKKTGGGNNYGNGNGGPISPGTKTTIVEQQEKEDKVKVKVKVKGRTSTAASPAASANTSTIVSCTSRSIIGSNGKRRKSPAVVMEGSRCSRVNGRGWRCCQQTLVGYSLCEHHLGKGRLRSMNSSAVRGQLGTSKPKWRMNHVAIPPASPQNQTEDHEEQPLATVLLGDGLDKIEEEDDKKTIERKMSWKKVGAMKARSISSLLDNMDNNDPSSPPSLVAQAPEVASSIYQ